MRRLVWLVLAVLLASCESSPSSLGPNAEEPAAPGLQADIAQEIQGRHIVVFRSDQPDAAALARQLVDGHGGSLHFVYEHALRGFAATLSDEAMAIIATHRAVVYTEPDAVVRAIETQVDPPSWGLDRVDQRDLPLDDGYSYDTDGTGVNVYVLDSGIRTTHQSFGGRAVEAFTAIDDGLGARDCYGHGTHVAGTIGSATYGVAKDVALYSVRVLDCSGNGTLSGVIAGVDWVTNNAVAPAVANMSLGGSASSALDDAVEASIASGVTYSLSAGNAGADACLQSPARTPSALTVGATNSSDVRASFSNYGTCLDVFAPGVGIRSTYNRSDTDATTLSGTSMAAPHVAGVAARILESDPSATPSQVAQILLGNATSGKVGSPGGGSPNLLLFANPDASPPAPDNPPTASFTVSCEGLTCTLDASGSTDDNGIVSYDWKLGKYPDPTASGQIVEATYPHAGQRTVTLTVTDAAGQADETSKTFEVSEEPQPDQPPTASFTATCNGLTCTLDASGSTDDKGIVRYDWNTGQDPDRFRSGKVVEVAYGAEGSYTVTLRVIDGAGQRDFQTRTIEVTPSVDAPPVASFTVSCSGLTCTLDASGSTDDNGIVSYDWNLGKYPDPTATGKIVETTYPHAGQRTVTLTVTDGSDQADSASQTFQITDG